MVFDETPVYLLQIFVARLKDVDVRRKKSCMKLVH
jgi:hypothetical protein